MKRQWTHEELTDAFTLSSKELDLVGDSKTDHTVLSFAVLLKYFQQEGRFPSQKHDIPSVVIVHLAQQLGVVPEKIIPYDWEGRTIKVHRAAIRTFLVVHEATLSDEEAMIEWLCPHVLAEQRQEDGLIASVYAHCKNRIASTLSWSRSAHLLACRTQSCLYLLATETLLFLGGRRDDNGVTRLSSDPIYPSILD